jgi:ethanolamine utilization microcompartment shell protein EutL
MANTAYTQQVLADASSFRLRLQNALTKVAFEVMEEATATPFHAQRVAYAQRVINDPANIAMGLAASFVNRPNIFAFETTYDFAMRSAVTASGDPDIESQVHTDWDMLAGVTDQTGP